MLEKIKDFLYDISDIVISLAIIAVIFYAVSWKISDTLDPELDASFAQNSATDTTPIDETESDLIEIIPDETPVTDLPLVETEDTTPSPEVTSPSDGTTKPASKPIDLKAFIVDSGSSAYSIGQNLETQGFVEDSDVFVNRLIERGLDTKLFAGTFKISPSDELDVIIDILTGKSRN